MVKVKLYSLFMNQEIRDLLLISAPFQLILKQPFNRNNRKYIISNYTMSQCYPLCKYKNEFLSRTIYLQFVMGRGGIF